MPAQVTIILNAADIATGYIDWFVTPNDMGGKITEALASGEEKFVFFRTDYPAIGKGEPTWFAYFPNLGRGAVNAGGNTEWTDATGIDDLQNRWENYEDRWSN